MKRPAAATSKRRLKIACWLAGVAIAVLVFAPIKVHTRTRYTCSRCRVEKTEHCLLGHDWQSSRSTELTEWYVLHRSHHEHLWERSSCVRGRNVLGTTVWWGCGSIHPVGTLPPRVEREYLEGADEMERARFFEGILSTNRDSQKQAVNEALEKALGN